MELFKGISWGAYLTVSLGGLALLYLFIFIKMKNNLSTKSPTPPSNNYQKKSLEVVETMKLMPTETADVSNPFERIIKEAEQAHQVQPASQFEKERVITNDETTREQSNDSESEESEEELTEEEIQMLETQFNVSR